MACSQPAVRGCGCNGSDNGNDSGNSSAAWAWNQAAFLCLGERPLPLSPFAVSSAFAAFAFIMGAVGKRPRPCGPLWKESNMKNNARLRYATRFAGLALATSAFVCLGAGTALAATATQTDATTSSVTYEFSGLRENCTITMGDVVAYDTVQDYADKKGVTVPQEYIQELTPERAVFTDLPAGASSYCFKVTYHYVYNNGGLSGDDYITLWSPVTVASKVKASSVKIRSQYNVTKNLYFSFANPGNFFGYELKLVGKDGKKKTLKYDTSGIVQQQSATVQTNSIKVALNQVYTAQVRTYIKVGKDKKTKKYSAWSDTTLLVPQPVVSGKKYPTYAKLTWAKTKGAKNYTVYASAKQNKGYKKVTTTTKTSCTVAKVGGKKMTKGKTYYYYVVAKAKYNGKTYTSPVIYRYC